LALQIHPKCRFPQTASLAGVAEMTQVTDQSGRHPIATKQSRKKWKVFSHRKASPVTVNEIFGYDVFQSLVFFDLRREKRQNPIDLAKIRVGEPSCGY
jgi:hypothetical protein